MRILGTHISRHARPSEYLRNLLCMLYTKHFEISLTALYKHTQEVARYLSEA